MKAARLDAFLNRNRGAGDPGPSAEEDLEVLLDRAAEVFSRSVAPTTRATYARRWVIFERWCNARNLASLPASSETVMMHFVEAVADSGVSLSTLRGWAAAINRVHLEAGLSPPGEDPAMAMFLRGLSRAMPRQPPATPISALRIDALRTVCRYLDAAAVNAIEVRDRALLTLCQCGLNDAEIAYLTWEGVTLTARTAKISVGPTGRRGGRSVRLKSTSDPATCPVKALREWQTIVGRLPGPVFTLVDRLGHQTGGPLNAEAVRRIRRSRRTSLGVGGRWASLEQCIALLGGHASDVLRDKALLLVGFAGAFRRNELTQLRWSDLTATKAGLVVNLRRSKTDQMGHGVQVGIPLGRSVLTCPVTAMERWRERYSEQLGSAASSEAACFVKIGRAGRLGEAHLTEEALTRIVRRRAEEAGLDGRWGGRSLRAGFISTAADLNIPLEEIARQSRHATLDSLVLYIREEDPLRRNPAARMGL
jgi:integrase